MYIFIHICSFVDFNLALMYVVPYPCGIDVCVVCAQVLELTGAVLLSEGSGWNSPSDIIWAWLWSFPCY